MLVHGLGADRRVWSPVLEPLAARFDVIAMDLPGFGATPPLPASDPPMPARLAQVTIDFLATLGIERAHLVGNSLGAWIALEAAACGAARSVTSLCAAGLWPKPLLNDGERPRQGARRLAELARPVLLAAAGTAAGRRAVLSLTVRDGSRLTAREARQLLSMWLDAPGYSDTNQWMRRGAFTDWGKINAPVTLAWGEYDRMVVAPRHPPAGVPAVVLPGCAHLPMWDDPELVVRTILETVARSETHLDAYDAVVTDPFNDAGVMDPFNDAGVTDPLNNAPVAD